MMKVYIRTLAGKSAEIDVGPNNTIYDIKVALQDRFGFRADSTRVIFRGKCWDDHCTMDDCGVGEGDTFNCVFPLGTCDSTLIKFPVEVLDSNGSEQEVLS